MQDARHPNDIQEPKPRFLGSTGERLAHFDGSKPVNLGQFPAIFTRRLDAPHPGPRQPNQELDKVLHKRQSTGGSFCV